MATILIVEDDMFIRELLEMTVNGWGYDTLLAGDVEEAILFFKTARVVDLLFTDVYLRKSVFGGCEVARKAKMLRPKLKVLYTTGNLINAEMKAMFVEGARCIRKPYTDIQLRESFVDALAA